MAERKTWARELQVQYNASVVKCCDVVGISRTAYYYEPKLTDDDEIIDALNALIDKHHRWGVPEVLQTPSKARPPLEPQACLSRLYWAKTEPATQRQKAITQPQPRAIGCTECIG